MLIIIVGVRGVHQGSEHQGSVFIFKEVASPKVFVCLQDSELADDFLSETCDASGHQQAGKDGVESCFHGVVLFRVNTIVDYLVLNFLF